MKNKLTEEEHEKITQILKDDAKTNVKNIFNSELTLRTRAVKGLNGIVIYLFFAIAWIIRNYSFTTEFLKIRLGITFKWIVIVLISAWVLAGILHNASSYK